MMARKKAEIHPPIHGALPPERLFYIDCVQYDLTGIDPPPAFVRELLMRYLELAKPRKLTGPEIAAIVDFRAIHQKISISQAVHVTHNRFGGELSVENIKKHHDRYGMSRRQIEERRKVLDQAWEPDDEYDNASEDEKRLIEERVIKETNDRLKEDKRKWEAYEKAKKDVFG